MAFQGRLVHLATAGDTVKWMYLLDGASLRINKTELKAAGDRLGYQGTVTQVRRKAKGAAGNGFIVNTALPLDGSLNGKTLFLTLPKGRADGKTLPGKRLEGYTIHHVKALAGTKPSSLVYVNEEPGLEIRDSTKGAGIKMVKYVYYPWTGLIGPLFFNIPGSLFRDELGKVQCTGKLVGG